MKEDDKIRESKDVRLNVRKTRGEETSKRIEETNRKKQVSFHKK
jgi:hypothetical protein